MPEPSGKYPIVCPSGSGPQTYRVNAGTVAFVPFGADSIEEACEYLRQNRNPHTPRQRLATAMLRLDDCGS